MRNIDEERQFQEERKNGLGSSDCPGVYSIGYHCGRALQYDKRDVPQDYPKDETAAMERGTMLQAPTIDLYRKRTGRKVITHAPMLHRTHTLYPHMLVHVDGLIVEALGHTGMGVLEAKVLSNFNFRKQRRDGLDLAYILQVQHALAVTGLTWGSYAILCPDPWELIWFDVERDQSLIDKLIEDEGGGRAKARRQYLQAKKRKRQMRDWSGMTLSCRSSRKSRKSRPSKKRLKRSKLRRSTNSRGSSAAGRE